MLIRYRNGLLLEANVLSLIGGLMRVAVKNSDDTLELRLIGETWVDETGEIVTFDFTMAILAAVGIVPPCDGPVDAAPLGLAPALPLDLPGLGQSIN